MEKGWKFSANNHFENPKQIYFLSPFQNERIELSKRSPSRQMIKNQIIILELVENIIVSLHWKTRQICHVLVGGDSFRITMYLFSPGTYPRIFKKLLKLPISVFWTLNAVVTFYWSNILIIARSRIGTKMNHDVIKFVL